MLPERVSMVLTVAATQRLPLLGQALASGGGVGGLLRMAGHFADGAHHLAHGAGELLYLGELPR